MSDKIFDIKKSDLNITGNKYEVIEQYTANLKPYKSKYENEYDSQFNDYRLRNQKTRHNYVYEKSCELPISKKL